MATIPVTQARYLGNSRGLAPITRGGPEHPNLKETASQSYAAGAPVYYDSNGTIAVAVASSSVITQIAGIALEAATGTTGAPVRYRPISPGDRYVVHVTSNGSSTTTALTQVGDVCNFDLSNGNLVANVNGTDATKVAARIIALYTVVSGYADGDTVGDTSGRVVVEFIGNEALQG